MFWVKGIVTLQDLFEIISIRDNNHSPACMRQEWIFLGLRTHCLWQHSPGNSAVGGMKPLAMHRRDFIDRILSRWYLLNIRPKPV